MFHRKSVVVAVAVMSLGLGTTITLARADSTAQDKQTADKNPASPNDKQSTVTAADIHQHTPISQQQMDDLKMQEQTQDKMKSDLMANYSDADFVKVASMSNQDEIEAAKQALDKTNNQNVKDFANHMIQDHTKAGDELKALAEKKGWQISDQPDAKHMIAMLGMDKMDPSDFDKAYASAMVADHEGAIALFKYASEKTQDQDLKTFVNNALPTFEEHLKMAQDLETKLTAMGMAK
jgi:putative membrane protein